MKKRGRDDLNWINLTLDKIYIYSVLEGMSIENFGR